MSKDIDLFNNLKILNQKYFITIILIILLVFISAIYIFILKDFRTFCDIQPQQQHTYQ